MLIFFSVGNTLMVVPSGARYLNFAYFLTLIMILLYIHQNILDYKFKRLITFLSPAFILFIIISVRIGLYSMSITTIIGNPFIALFSAGDNVSINDLIK